MSACRLSLAALAALVAGSPALAGHVWIVDASGGGYSDIQQALPVVSDGDVIFVREGDYGPVTIGGSVDASFAIVAPLHANVLCGPVTVLDRPAGSVLVMSGLEIRGAANQARLTIESCAGSVRVQSCTVEGVRVEEASDVVLSNCAIEPSGLGVWALGSTLGVHRCYAYGGPSNTAILVDAGSDAFITGSFAYGGSGQSTCLWGYDGGDGVGVWNGSHALVIGSELAGGSEGECWCFGCQWGFAGVRLRADATSTAEEIAGPPRTLTASHEVAPDCAWIEILVEGAPGDEVRWFSSRRTVAEVDPGVLGVRGVADAPFPGDPSYRHRRGQAIGGDPPLEPLQLPSVLTLPETGRVAVTVPVNPLPAGQTSDLVHVQALVTASGGQRYYTNPVAIAIVARPEGCPKRLYVDVGAAPGGDGSSWERAYRDVQDALEMARSLDTVRELWVAEGNYRPAPAEGPREATFAVPPGMRVYGGFVGNETSLGQRNVDAHATTLTGDLAQDDGTVGNDENAYHVVSLSPARGQRLDGLRIFAGNTSGGVGLYQTSGGGILAKGFAYDGWWSLADSRLRRNAAARGGGVYTEAPLACLRTRFVDNVASSSRGGGLYAWNVPVTAFGLRVFENSAVGGGGLSLRSLDSVRDGRNLVVDSSFVGNTTSGSGGGASVQAPRTTFTACTFHANQAGTGGGLRAFESAIEVYDCVFWANQSPNGHPGVEANGSVDARYSCVQSPSLTGPGVTDQDPLFVDPLGADGIAGTADDDLRLQAGSPCVDAGDASLLPADVLDLDGDGDHAEPLPLDLDGTPRRQDDPATADTGPGSPPHVDMGAFERDGV